MDEELVLSYSTESVMADSPFKKEAKRSLIQQQRHNPSKQSLTAIDR